MSPDQGSCVLEARMLIRTHSASPLNGAAANFWDNDMAEFQRQVLLRHRDLSDEELRGEI